MQDLNLPFCELTFREENGKKFVLDKLRKKYIVLTPEEWVRQSFVHYLITHKGYPAGLIANEKSLKVNGLNFRTDTVVYGERGTPLLLIEFKAPTVSISEDTLFQVAKYNKKLGVPYFILSNGLDHYCFEMIDGRYIQVDDIPEYKYLIFK